MAMRGGWLSYASDEIKRRRDGSNGFPPLVPKIEGDSVRILSDLEADSYLHKRVEHEVRALGRSVRLRTRIDRSGMDAEQRRLADSRDRIATATYFSARRAMTKQRRIERIEHLPMIDDGGDA